MFSYFIYFLAFTLVFCKLLDPNLLPLFVIPHFITASILTFYTPEDNLYISSKRMLIFESL